MTKNLVLCLDGTSNDLAGDYTNIARTYGLLLKHPDRQVVYYDPGVGTAPDPRATTGLGRRASLALGQAIGSGLAANVEQAYLWVCEHYEPGDRLFLFGFSRGAYTCRVLAGLIHLCGVTHRGMPNLVPYTTQLHSSADFGAAARFRKRFSVDGLHGALTKAQEPGIHFLGLYDTVAAYGWLWNPTYRPYTTNNPSVRTVRHALALDERRSPFTPLPWGRPHTDVKEVWFAGVHSDVGGGYPEKTGALSYIPLGWMLAEAVTSGLLLDDGRVRAEGLLVSAGPDAPANESLQGAQWLFQVVPKRVWSDAKGGLTWKAPRGRRSVWTDCRIHQAVFDREGYAPANLPEGCAVEPWHRRDLTEPGAPPPAGAR
ncbi:MAG: DUF2235 domain-containing protein [Myxococcota bacterium]